MRGLDQACGPQHQIHPHCQQQGAAKTKRLKAMNDFVGNADLRKAAGGNARLYTEQNFDPKVKTCLGYE